MKRALLLCLAIILAFAVVVFGWPLVLELGEPETGVAAQAYAGQVEHGQYLATAGNCASCHTARGGAIYAGGRAIETPFGQVFSSNITPDRATGIGNWTADDFWRALHHGKSKNGRLLYPAFPYPNYTKVTRADSDAMFAYLQTLPAVDQANRQHALRMPYSTQPVLAIWRALYFRPGVYQAEANRSAEWNRGAYLVQGLGHCNACHTSRDVLGGSDEQEDLAGGMMPMSNWYASSLTSDSKAGLGNWEKQHIADLLKTGVSERAAVFGPMSEVVYKSLQYLNDSDMQAMAEYLKSLPQSTISPPSGDAVLNKAQQDFVMDWGGKLYGKHCAGCHGEKGQGRAPAYLPFADRHSLSMSSAVNSIRIVMNGGYPPGTAGNPRPFGMPPFRSMLSDEEVAAVVSYIRNAWGNQAGWVTPDEVNRYRSVPVN